MFAPPNEYQSGHIAQAINYPVNLLGYGAINLAEGISESIQWYELKAEQEKRRQLIDVQNPAELAKGRFPKAINLPLNQLRERMNEL